MARLLKACTACTVINEQSHIDCGAPDLTLLRKGMAVAYIEAKDLEDGDLDGRSKHKEQFDRYKAALETIVFTDYLAFHLYVENKLQIVVQLAIIQNGKIVLNEGALGQFESLIDKIRYAKAQTITSASKLAELMANKAKLIKEAVRLDLARNTDKTGGLYSQLEAFKDVINKDLDEEKFADLYAQTIVYGLFAARIHDESPEDFTRDEARKLIPRTNPFLRTVFQHLAGDDIEDSIAWIVDDLVTIFAATKVNKLRANFEKEMQKRDPMIHFYEEFLKKYNPEAKKKYGVFYTPPEVVEFIVRAVDDILKDEFKLMDGLADCSRLDVPDENGCYQHRVQILDPATGTGTFLAEVVSRIKERQQPGIWPKYVREHLLPRIYGFECMMAPYTIAHLKLDMLINLRGADFQHLKKDDRVNIYLTNSLIEEDVEPKVLFAKEIAEEANKANKIKHSAPVMVMIGNPPYAVSSNNKGPEFKWIEGLLNDYKKNLNERNIQPLSDDYIKFIRLAQHYVERTGEGIVAYISNNSFLDGLIHRQMRRELMRCFDDIYILDLHGNNRKNETAPDGSKDENVFDIMQGVSINIFIKKKESSDKQAEIHHYDLYGTRKAKEAFLSEKSISSIEWQLLQPIEPNLFFVPKDFSEYEEYNSGFKVDDLMKISGSGIESGRDELFIGYSREQVNENVREVFENPQLLKTKYGLKEDSSFKLLRYIKEAKYSASNVREILLSPFNTQYVYYDKTLLRRSFYETLQHMLKPNICLSIPRQTALEWRHVLLGDKLLNGNYLAVGRQNGASINFPLYLYPSESELGFESERKPNLDDTIWHTIENWVKYGQAYKPQTQTEQSGLLDFNNEQTDPHFLAPEDILDYIYGVLHSPHYREKYKEFLKVDFPRIPYPKNANEFEHYRECGHQLRELHLMHNVPESPVSFDEPGNCMVEQIRPIPNIDDGYSYSIYINEKQFFAYVPTEAWEMYIGGYQPAQKWLKDRKGRILNTEDILHYEKIISVLLETKRIMDTIDDPSLQVAELKQKVRTLEHQLHEREKNSVINNIHIDTFNNYQDDHSQHLNIEKS